MRIIAIEGIDGSGKSLQTDMMVSALESRGKSVALLSFPSYERFFGKEIGEILSGSNGVRADEVDSHSLCLWYALDRFETMNALVRNIDTAGTLSDKIALYYKDIDFLILNRFTLSNAVYQSVREIDIGLPDNWEWVQELEHGQLGLPRPDLYLILDVAPHSAQRNVDMKEEREYVKGRDIYEAQEDLLSRARLRYLDIASREKNMQVISCEKTEGGMQSIDVIANRIEVALDERGYLE